MDFEEKSDSSCEVARALVASPLMIGCDMTKLDGFTFSLLANDEVIAIDQDSLGAGAGCVAAGADWEIWARPLADGSIAAGLYNKALKEQTIMLDMEKLGILCKWTVRDVWLQQDEAEGLRQASRRHGRHSGQRLAAADREGRGCTAREVNELMQ